MNKKFAVGAGIAFAAFALAAKDPIIMTVNGIDVPKSEFEYLYGKNSKQQLLQQSLDDYVEMFKLYKMKVADAKAEGIDTTASFRREMAQYRRDLAAPYLADSTFLFKLLKETYDRTTEEVEANHIMFFKTRDAHENAEKRNRLDSIRQTLLNGGDFAEAAIKYSEDGGSNKNGGKMGYIRAQQFPYYFELAAYETPEGEISEVVESPVGYHILKGGKHRPARGTVQVAHILKLSPQGDTIGVDKAYNTIDSIYKVVKADPSKFADLAQRFSDDKGSSQQGGMLPWFGPGEMVAEFDSVAFSMSDNTICAPFRTSYGWHIINRIAGKPVPSMQEIKPGFIARVTNPQDERYPLIKNNQTKRLEARHKVKLNDKVLNELRNKIQSNGLDSVFYASYAADSPAGKESLFVIDGVGTPVSDFVKSMHEMIQEEPVEAEKIFKSSFDDFYNSGLVDAELARLEREEPDYRNLLHEYIDGSLLYEVSVRKVWDKAAKDNEGLKNYFNTHRDNYKWSVPHAKGYLVQAVNDSIGARIREVAAKTGRDSLVNTIRKTFEKNASIEKVLVEKGSNAMIDNLLFEGEKAAPTNKNFTVFFMIDPKILTAPEEYTDVRGLVTSDYQNECQSQWEDELKKKYPARVNKKVLKSVKN